MDVNAHPCGGVHPWKQALSHGKLAQQPLYDDDDKNPVWPTWAVGALFRGARPRDLFYGGVGLKDMLRRIPRGADMNQNSNANHPDRASYATHTAWREAAE
jgi:hypothetical protein